MKLTELSCAFLTFTAAMRFVQAARIIGAAAPIKFGEVSVRQKKNNDEEKVSEQEVWSTIRYLDPDIKAKARNIAATVTLMGIRAL
jgi:hypothetical protein